MRSKTLVLTAALGSALVVAACAVAAWWAVQGSAQLAPFGAPPVTGAPLAASNWLSRQRVSFEPDASGGVAAQRFLARGPAYTLFLDPTGAALQLREPTSSSTLARFVRLLRNQWFRSAAAPMTLELGFAGARAIRWLPLDALPGQSHYFQGDDPQRWRTHVPHFARLWASDLYPGIDLIFHGSGGELEYDFRVAAGADPSRIRVRAGKADAIELSADGAARLRVGAASVELRRPVAYQVHDGERREIPARFRLVGGLLEFALGDYDRSLPLVIDPVLSYTSFVGGSDSTTNGLGLAVDSTGNAYVTGSTCTADFPSTPGSVGTQGGSALFIDACEDVFITKFNADGSGLAYSTFLRGNHRETAVRIAVDAAGAAYLTGITLSTDFPTTPGAFSRTARGGECTLIAGFKTPCADAFVAKLSPDGANLAYSTYLGGSGMDLGFGIAVDPTGAAYVSGWTNSSDLPSSATAFQKAYAGGTCFGGFTPCYDAFVAKLSANGSGLDYLTYLGGGNQEFAGNVAVDAGGNATVVGSTSSSNFPTTPGVVGVNHSAGTQDDVFVTKLNANGSAVLYSTLVGGTGTDWPLSLALDGTGAAYVAGATVSPDFPVTPGALQGNYAGPPGAGCDLLVTLPVCGDAFVFKLNPTATEFVLSTFLGGSGDDSALGLAVDSAQRIWLAGATRSVAFPSTPDAYYPAGNGNGFVVQLSADGSQRLYSSGLTAVGLAHATDLKVDAADNAYVLGVASSFISGPFPTTPGAYSAGQGGAMVSKFAAGSAPALQLSATAISFGTQTLSSTSAVRDLVLSNPNSTALALALSIIGETSPAFMLSHNCPPLLAAAQSCTASLRFQPSSPGNTSATLQLRSNAPGAPHTVSLSGFGADVQSGGFLPSSLGFGAQQVGSTSGAQTAQWVAQTSNVFPQVKSVSVEGPHAADFALDLASCAQGDNFCAVAARFAPQAGASGVRSASLVVGADVYGSPFTLPLSGTVASAAALAVTPARLDFGNVALPGPAQSFLTLKNNGTGPLTVTSVVASLGDYSLMPGGNCSALPITLAAQASCTQGVRFAPAQTGLRDANLSIGSSAPGSPLILALSGIGVDANGPQLGVSAASADFGVTQVGTKNSLTRFFTLFNFGNQPATLDITLAPEFPPDANYSLCGASLGANATCSLALGFAPTATGTRSATVTIASNAPGGTRSISLSGVGILVPHAAVTPHVVDFGRVGVGATSLMRTITLANTGNGALNVGGVSVSPPFSATNRCPTTLAAASSCSIDVLAQPVAASRSDALLTITDDAAGGAQRIALSVQGFNGAALQVRPGSLDFGNQAVGSTSATRAVTITNTGNAAASGTGIAVNGDFVQSHNCGASLAAGASCVADVAFRPTLSTTPFELVGVLAVAGGGTGSPALLALKGVGVAAAGTTTTTQLTSSANPSGTGQSVTFTVAVTAAGGGSVAGNVNFFDGAVLIGSATLSSGSASLGTASLAAGNHLITAQYAGNSSFAASTSAALAQQVNSGPPGADFALELAPASLSVVAGQSAATTATVTPSGGFNQVVSFSCGPLPVGASCEFAPSSLTPSGSALGATLTLRTNGAALAAWATPADRDSGALWFASLGASATGAAWRRRSLPPSRGVPGRKGWLVRAGAVLMGAVALWVTGCGGGGGGGGGAAGSGTPAGTAAVTVSATAGSGAAAVTRSATLTLTVTR